MKRHQLVLASLFVALGALSAQASVRCAYENSYLKVSDTKGQLELEQWISSGQHGFDARTDLWCNDEAIAALIGPYFVYWARGDLQIQSQYVGDFSRPYRKLQLVGGFAVAWMGGYLVTQKPKLSVQSTYIGNPLVNDLWKSQDSNFKMNRHRVALFVGHDFVVSDGVTVSRQFVGSQRTPEGATNSDFSLEINDEQATLFRGDHRYVYRNGVIQVQPYGRRFPRELE